jgi:ferredoxin-fold anticodon binding domain-containing protein
MNKSLQITEMVGFSAHTRFCGAQFLDDQKEMHADSACQQFRTDKCFHQQHFKLMAVTVLHELAKWKQEKTTKKMLDLHCLQ